MPNTTEGRLPDSYLASTSDYESVGRLNGLASWRLTPGSSCPSSTRESQPPSRLYSPDDRAEQIPWSGSSNGLHPAPPCGSSPWLARNQSALPSNWLSQESVSSLAWEQSPARRLFDRPLDVTRSSESAPFANYDVSTGSQRPVAAEASAPGATIGQLLYDVEGAAGACNQGSASPIIGSPKSSRRRKRSGNGDALMEQRPRYREFRDAQGVLQGTSGVYGARQNTRGKLSPDQKASKALQGPSCAYCRHLKRKCSFSVSSYRCDRCIFTNSLNLHIPCVNPGIVDAILFRGGPPDDIANHPLRFADHFDRVWEVSIGSPGTRRHEIELTQDFGVNLKVPVGYFVPRPGDRTAYTWSTEDGETTALEMPCYCICDPEAVEKQLAGYIQSSAVFNLAKHVDFDWSDQIISSTFRMAVRLADSSELIHQTLVLWSSTRVIEETWRICGDDTLGMTPARNDVPWAGIIPVTPIMDQQLDQLVIHNVLKPVGKWVLKQLNARFQKVAKRKTVEDWLEIFLTSFILLHNCAVQLHAEQAFARRYGMSGRYGPYGHYKDAENQFDTARIILAYFHSILRDAPLSAITLTARVDIELDHEQRSYLDKLRTWVSASANDMQELKERNQYEHGLYFTHQLLFDDYNPQPTDIKELPKTDR